MKAAILKACVVIILALAIGPLSAHAQSYSISKLDVTFELQQDGSVRQTNRFFFNSSVSGTSLQYRLADAARDIEAFDDVQKLDARLVNVTGGYLINISLKQPTDTLVLNYTTDNAVFQSNSVSYFFTEMSFESEISDLAVRIKLPEGFVIYKNSFRPSDAVLLSDGQRIVLLWNEKNATGASFSVKFNMPDNGSSFLFGAIALLTGISVLLYLYFRERTREEFMQGFREDEKKTIDYLREKKVALQSDLQKEFRFSRAKSTRIVSVLEQKGLVRKQRYGRTNRLSWLK